MSSQDIVWEEPPRGGRVRWGDVLVELTHHPGRWARLATYTGETSAYKVAQRLRRDDSLPPGRWEFVGRKVDGGGSRLYGRYLGPDE